MENIDGRQGSSAPLPYWGSLNSVKYSDGDMRHIAVNLLWLVIQQTSRHCKERRHNSGLLLISGVRLLTIYRASCSLANPFRLRPGWHQSSRGTAGDPHSQKRASGEILKYKTGSGCFGLNPLGVLGETGDVVEKEADREPHR